MAVPPHPAAGFSCWRRCRTRRRSATPTRSRTATTRWLLGADLPCSAPTQRSHLVLPGSLCAGGRMIAALHASGRSCAPWLRLVAARWHRHAHRRGECRGRRRDPCRRREPSGSHQAEPDRHLPWAGRHFGPRRPRRLRRVRDRHDQHQPHGRAETSRAPRRQGDESRRARAPSRNPCRRRVPPCRPALAPTRVSTRPTDTHSCRRATVPRSAQLSAPCSTWSSSPSSAWASRSRSGTLPSRSGRFSRCSTCTSPRAGSLGPAPSTPRTGRPFDCRTRDPVDDRPQRSPDRPLDRYRRARGLGGRVALASGLLFRRRDP